MAAKLEAKGIVAALDAVSAETFSANETERLQVREAALRLLSRVESPFERASSYCFDHPAVYAAIQTFIDLGIWPSWTQAGAGEKTVEELAKLASQSIELNLLRRLCRLLAAFHIIEEKAEDKYAPTPFSKAIGENEKILQMLQAGTDHYLAAAKNLPVYLAKTSYKEPFDASVNNYSETNDEKLNFFDRLMKYPDFNKSFIGHMTGYTAWKTPWTEVYDTGSLVKGAKLGEGCPPLVVDLGGNTGLDISRVLAKHPDLPAGSLVLEDLPEVIERAEVDKKVTTLAHDFFKPQPVKGARAYYMHAVLHDWSDEKSKELLSNVREAMEPGYSKLLIYEAVIPPTGASMNQTVMDVHMMSLLSAFERTQASWTKLLTEAGFKTPTYFPDPRKIETVIETEIA
ncbi:S-adenosyl-L-methionine-dependent methyltransferase [Xylariomycetidae sp. FL2044]|nr:S-adenosyl-L-methionine-dependent methyltransferase [Xylariomycetidae sp. FL2044]